LWEALRDWNAVPNGDSVFPYQNVFDYEPYDSLTLRDTQRIGHPAQAGEEGR
jgi:hypothetical protein